MANVLAVRYLLDTPGGTLTQPEVYVNFNGAIGKIGNSFGAFETTDNTQDKNNLAVQFLGPKAIYAWVGLNIYKLNTGTSNWDIVHTPTGQSSVDRHTGLFVMHPNGVPTLVGMFAGASNEWKAVTSTDGSTWVEHSSGINNNNLSVGGPKKAVVYGNWLIAPWGSALELAFFNADTKDFAPINFLGYGGFTSVSVALCPFQGRLYAHAASVSGYTNLYIWSGGQMAKILTGASSIFGVQLGAGTNGYLGLFEHGNQLVAYGYQDRGTGDAGLRMWTLNVSNVESTGLATAIEVTNPAVPLNTVVGTGPRYPTGQSASTAGGFIRVYHQIDNETQSGASPTTPANFIWICHAATNVASNYAHSITKFQWVNSFTTMNYIGNSGTGNTPDFGMALTDSCHSFGEYSVSNSAVGGLELFIQETAPRQLLSNGAIRITFVADGNSGGGAIYIVKLHIRASNTGVPGSSDMHVPDDQVGGILNEAGEILPGSATGGSATTFTNGSGRTVSINNVTADGTTYTFDWNVSFINQSNTGKVSELAALGHLTYSILSIEDDPLTTAVTGPAVLYNIPFQEGIQEGV